MCVRLSLTFSPLLSFPSLSSSHLRPLPTPLLFHFPPLHRKACKRFPQRLHSRHCCRQRKARQTQLHHACRNPASRFLRMADGSRGQSTNNEYLNTAPLSRVRCRANLRYPASCSFGRKRPEGLRGYFPSTRWGSAVHVQHVMTMAITIAIRMRMRVQGACNSGVPYRDEGQDWRGRYEEVSEAVTKAG